MKKDGLQAEGPESGVEKARSGSPKDKAILEHELVGKQGAGQGSGQAGSCS